MNAKDNEARFKGARGGTYKVEPGLYTKYVLFKRVLFVFWEFTSCSDDIKELVDTVKTVNGQIINMPS